MGNFKFYRPRINIDVSEDVYEQLKRLPHGTRKVLMNQVMAAIARELKANGGKFIADVISAEVEIRDILRMEAKDGTGGTQEERQ